MKSLVRGAVALVAVLAPMSASASPVTGSLPPVKQALTTSKAVDRTCADRARSGSRGVAFSSYRAPMAGFISSRLAASRCAATATARN